MGNSTQIQPQADDVQDRIRELYPLRWFLVLWCIVVYAWSTQWLRLVKDMDPREGIRFAALMALHAVALWIGPSLLRYPRGLYVYLVAQGGIVLALAVTSQNAIVAFFLSIAMAGTAVLLLGRLRPSIVALIGYSFLLLVSSVVARRPFDALFFVLFGLPLMLFTAGGAAMFIRQANARQRAQRLLRELEASHRELEEYAKRVEELTLNAERQRLARELHDTLAQGLAGLIMQLEAIDTHLERGSPTRARVVTQQAMARARTTLGEARRAIQSLRAPALEPKQMLDAIRGEANQFTSATGVPCTLDVGEGEWAAARAVAEHALRIVQEGLTNIARHAQAEHAWIRCTQSDGELELTIRDDGVGFDVSRTERDGHFGLIGLRERLQLAGGTLSISSRLGEGTCLTARLSMTGRGDR